MKNLLYKLTFISVSLIKIKGKKNPECSQNGLLSKLWHLCKILSNLICENLPKGDTLKECKIELQKIFIVV